MWFPPERPRSIPKFPSQRQCPNQCCRVARQIGLQRPQPSFRSKHRPEKAPCEQGCQRCRQIALILRLRQYASPDANVTELCAKQSPEEPRCKLSTTGRRRSLFQVWPTGGTPAIPQQTALQNAGEGVCRQSETKKKAPELSEKPPEADTP